MGGCMEVSQVTILETRCPINIVNAKVGKYGCLLLFNVKMGEI